MDMSNETKDSEWFSTWFDSPYYHILYGHRDESEAQRFLNALTNLDIFKPGVRIADVCCGKGRHTAYLHEKGFEVVGYDLSAESISYCRKFIRSGMSFHVHDIRKPIPDSGFDVVLNLFTSYGYFKSEEENVEALKNMCDALKPSGRILIDYMNTSQVVKNLVLHEVVEREGILFHVSRAIQDNKLVKRITFADEGRSWEFSEQVALLGLDDFKRQLSTCGMEIENVYGNYDLHPFDEQTSNRMIILAKRTEA